MSRFSLKTQILMFAALLVAMLLANTGTSWVINQSLTNSIYESRIGNAQLKSLDDIKEDIEQGLGDIYAYVVGDEDGIERLRGNMDEVTAEIDLARERFVDVSIPEARQQQAFDTLIAQRGPLEALEAQLKSLQSADFGDRKEITNTQVVPLIAEVRGAVNGLQDAISDKNGIIKDRISGLIVTSQRVQLGVSIAATLVSVLVALIFGKRLSTPIQQAAQAIQNLASKEYDTEILGLDRKDEVGVIARNLRDLSSRLEAADATEARAALENDLRVELFNILGSAMSGLKQGDLSRQIEGDRWSSLGDSYTALCSDFNDLAHSLAELVSQLDDSSSVVEQNAQDMEKMAETMSQRAETQAATLEQSAAALEEMSASVSSSAAQARDADREMEEGRRRAEEGGGVMQQAKEAMHSIASYSDQISNIITTIDDIAFQTSLLALNAGVEAARAGEAGRGFAVVASEVRNLAQKAGASANNIKQLVQDSSRQVKEGERLVEATSETLAKIVESVTNVNAMVSAIANSSSEQASGIKEINIGVSQLDKVTQENAAMVQETFSASQQMLTQSSRLRALLEGFSQSGAPISESDGDTMSWDDTVEAPTAHGGFAA